MGDSVYEHATENRKGSYWGLEPVFSGPLHMEPLSTILAFSENDPLPDLPNFSRNAYLGLGTRYGEEKRLILKIRTCTLRCATWGTSINDFSFFRERPFACSPKIFPKCTTQSRNLLRGWDMDHIVALNLYFQVHFNNFSFFSEWPFTWSTKLPRK